MSEAADIRTGLSLAGFLVAHAGAALAELDAREPLVPMALVRRDGEPTLLRFPADTQQEGVEEGRRAIAEEGPTAEGWAFAWEGRLSAEGQPPRDALIVEFWSRGMAAPLTLLQLVVRAGEGGPFRVSGLPTFVAGGGAVDALAARALLAGLLPGVREHPRAEAVLSAWR